MFTKEDMDIEFDIKLLTTGYLEGTVCLCVKGYMMTDEPCEFKIRISCCMPMPNIIFYDL